MSITQDLHPSWTAQIPYPITVLGNPSAVIPAGISGSVSLPNLLSSATISGTGNIPVAIP
jgi:hypothetical protein